MKEVAKVSTHATVSANEAGDSLLALKESLLHEEQVQLLYGGVPLAIIFNVLLASMLIGVMWPVVDATLASSWLAMLAIVLVWRAGIYTIFRKQGANRSDKSWLKYFRVLIVCTGMVWGLATLLIFPEEDITHQAFLAFVMAGVSSAAITSLAPDRVSAMGFIVPALIPLIVQFTLEGNQMSLSMGLMVAFFLVFLAAASARMQQNLIENIRLRAEAIEQQKAIRESEQRFRFILDTCPTAARIARTDSHEIVYSNQTYAELINAQVTHVGGVDPANYYANLDDYKNIMLRLGKGEQIFDQLIQLHIPHDPISENKWALASFLPIQFQGEPAVLGWFHDITERIRIERLKSEFVSTVSHELRTPLTAISGALGLLVGGLLNPASEQAMSMMTIAHKNSQRLNLLINDLLDMEKLAEGKLSLDMQSHSLGLLIEQALESNRSYGAERRVALQLTGAAQDVFVHVDDQRFMQVLSNLLSNAVKFSPDDAVVEITITQRDDRVRVTVSDRGPGISKEFRSRIFQKFAQADSSDTRQKGGTGLGLAITHELVGRMDGKIGFDSIEGEGASFYVEFPISSAKA